MPGRSAQPKEGRRERNEIRSKVGPENQKIPPSFLSEVGAGLEAEAQGQKGRLMGSFTN